MTRTRFGHLIALRDIILWTVQITAKRRTTFFLRDVFVGNIFLDFFIIRETNCAIILWSKLQITMW